MDQISQPEAQAPQDAAGAQNAQGAQFRGALALMGAGLGLAVYLVGQVFEDLFFLPAAQWGLGALLIGAAALALVLSGPLKLARALGLAIAAGLALSAFGGFYGLRFEAGDGFGETWPAMLTLIALSAIAAPFLIAGAERAGGLRDYGRLFDHAWVMVVRAAAALLFTGVFWALFFFSNGLLEAVGISLEDILESIDALPFLLSGAVFGLAMALVHEMSGYITPYLFVRFARVMLPLVLAVTALYIVAFPFGLRGGSGLSLSPVVSVLVMAAIATGLISALVDRDDSEAAQSRFLRGAAQLQAVILPALAAIAVYAIWLRVAQYGWTPQRIGAAMGAGYVALYALAYAGAVLRGFRASWMGRLRKANLYLAVALMVGLAASMTPLLNAQSISARAQEARMLALYAQPQGAQSRDDLRTLYALKTSYGLAGRAALARLEERAKTAGMEALAADIGAARAARSRYDLSGARRGDKVAANLAKWREALAVYPEGAEMPQVTPAIRLAGQIERWARSCANAQPSGEASCVLYMMDPDAFDGRRFGLIVVANPPEARVVEFKDNGDLAAQSGALAGIGRRLDKPAAAQLIAKIKAGDLRIAPRSGMALYIGDAEFVPAGR